MRVRALPAKAFYLAAGAMLAALLLASICRAAEARPVVRVSQGELAGITQGPVEAFLGIPYAAPPVGQNRWRSPQPAAHWHGVRSAAHFGASCYQTPAGPQGLGPWSHEYTDLDTPVSEDCLFLNLWTPSTKGKRPVLVWIHGGGFVAGSGSVPIYNGAKLAAQGIVVVTLNYRLGVFGFLAYPALAEEAQMAGEPPGNYGLQDVIAALEWLHRNAAAFGGDPEGITIAGQSAGSDIVHDLILSPLAAGLFRGAIAESGLPIGMPPPSLEQAEKVGTAFARSKGATSLAALRALSARDLNSASPKIKLAPGSSVADLLIFVPTVDGRLLPAPPKELLSEGKFNRVPILLGMTADESTGIEGAVGLTSEETWNGILRKTFGTMAPRFARMYPANTDAQRTSALQRMHRDLGLASIYCWTQLWLAHGTSPVYAYLWSHVEPGHDSARWLAFHSSEIPYVFETLDKAPERHFTALDRAISRRMSQYWLNFVKTADPNGPGLPQWPKLHRADPTIMGLGDRMAPRPILPSAKLSAMRAFMASGGHASVL